MHFIRWRLPWRAPPWAAAYSAGRRARGSGSGCGSSSKTRCSTPSQPVRWGGTESPTPAPKTLSHSHNHSITEAFPHNLCLSFFFFPSGQCSTKLFNSHISTVQPFLLGRPLYVTNEGILCALSVSSDKYSSECRTALFSLKLEILVIPISLLTARSVFLTCMPVFDVFTLVSSG